MLRTRHSELLSVLGWYRTSDLLGFGQALLPLSYQHVVARDETRGPFRIASQGGRGGIRTHASLRIDGLASRRYYHFSHPSVVLQVERGSQTPRTVWGNPQGCYPGQSSRPPAVANRLVSPSTQAVCTHGCSGKCSRRESNPHSRCEGPSSSPLDDRSHWIAVLGRAPRPPRTQQDHLGCNPRAFSGIRTRAITLGACCATGLRHEGLIGGSKSLFSSFRFFVF